ncbi:hypothetical protein MP228_000456 [Amoeboaphelidium protococcarum]|nr:hypothetical protein MP228_000456 [Amoeboaphelidium protococcarum]
MTRQCIVTVGPNPATQHILPVNNPAGTTVQSQGFSANVVMNVENRNVSSLPKNPAQPLKYFQLILDAQFEQLQGIKQPTFDDVLFGIEVNKILDLNQLGIPKWLIMAIQLWIKHLNSDVELYNFAHGGHIDNPTNLCQGSAVYMPFVLAVNTMDIRLPSVQYPSLLQQQYCQPLLGYPREMEQRYAEWQLLSSIHVRGPSTVEITNQFATQVPENTTYLLASKQAYDGYAPPVQLSAETIANFNQFMRRQMLRDKFSFSRLLTGKPGTTNHSFRNTLVFSPLLQFKFSMDSDYFDPNTFRFNPNLGSSRAHLSEAPPPTSISQFFNGRWAIDGGQILAERLPDGTVQSQVRLVARNRHTLEYYFCITLSLIL